MSKRQIFLAAFALLAGAAIFFAARDARRDAARDGKARPGFVQTRAGRFVVDGREFRFIGANAAVIYGDKERTAMPDTLRLIAESGMSVVRIWAFGESGPGDEKPTGIARNDWLGSHPFRRGPEDWNEEAFENLDRVIAEAARRNLRVQICLVNWWRDTGGVVRYLNWAGLRAAQDDSQPYGINVEQAMLFYTNPETRRLYREHVQRVVTRRNTVTGRLYRDDPTIMGYELMNEAQAATGRWAERRAWVAEMSAYLRSLDPDHLITPGTWGYRNSWERREWLADHRLPTVDFCDVHHYPMDDADSFVDTPADLRAFIENRAAAAYAVGKPLVFGEFGILPEGYKGVSQVEWYRAYFKSAAESGASGAMFWIVTPDLERGYSVTGNVRDKALLAEIQSAARLMDSLRDAGTPAGIRRDGHHLVPHQFVFTRPVNDPFARPELSWPQPQTLLYRFRPEQASSGRFERLGGGAGYIWGAGVGQFEYIVPAREDRRRVGTVVVRAHLQPVTPYDANGRVNSTRITLFINDTNCGARLVRLEEKGQTLVEEWRVDSWPVRLSAMRGQPLVIRFIVEADAGQPFGVNISNWQEGYDARDSQPIEVEVRR